MAELHPVVSLLIARMESHPEEFQGPMSRWGNMTLEVREFATGADLAAFNSALSKVSLDVLHERVMDELLNGDARRAEEKERAEKERSAHMAKLYSQQQALQQMQAYNSKQQYANAANTLSPLLGTTTSTAISATDALRLGDQTVDAGLIKSIKSKLGL